jgi:hypothetical protein
MSRSSLSQFQQALARTVAERFPHANRRFVRVKKMVLILLLRAFSGKNLNRPWLDTESSGVLDGCSRGRNQAPDKNFPTN